MGRFDLWAEIKGVEFHGLSPSDIQKWVAVHTHLSDLRGKGQWYYLDPRTVKSSVVSLIGKCYYYDSLLGLMKAWKHPGQCFFAGWHQTRSTWKALAELTKYPHLSRKTQNRIKPWLSLFLLSLTVFLTCVWGPCSHYHAQTDPYIAPWHKTGERQANIGVTHVEDVCGEV